MTTTLLQAFWNGAPRSSTMDQEWLDETVEALEKNEWKPSTTFYCNGAGWSLKFREEAAFRLLVALRKNMSAKALFLRAIDLQQNSLEALDTLFQSSTNFSSISICRLRMEGGEPLTIPASVFGNPSFRDIALEKCVLSKDGCNELANRLSSSTLHSLTLDDVELQGGLENLAEAIETSPSLTRLVIANTQITKKDFISLMKAIKRNVVLRTLHLHGLKLNAELAVFVADMLATNQHLQELSLRRNDLDHEAMSVLWGKDGLEQNFSLKSLMLSHNPIGDEGVNPILSCLQMESCVIQRLCLAHCEIWGEGCRNIALGLRRNTRLSRINLDGNQAEYVAHEFLATLQENMMLTEVIQSLPLILRNGSKLNEETVRTWKKIDFLLRWNAAGRRILKNDDSVYHLPHLLAKCTDPSIGFKFLQAASTSK